MGMAGMMPHAALPRQEVVQTELRRSADQQAKLEALRGPAFDVSKPQMRGPGGGRPGNGGCPGPPARRAKSLPPPCRWHGGVQAFGRGRARVEPVVIPPSTRSVCPVT